MVRVLSIFRKENYSSCVSHVKDSKQSGEYILFCSSRSKCTSWLSINVQILRSSSVFRTSSSESNTLSRPSGPHLCAASGCNAVETTPFTTANKESATSFFSLEKKTRHDDTYGTPKSPTAPCSRIWCENTRPWPSYRKDSHALHTLTQERPC